MIIVFDVFYNVHLCILQCVWSILRSLLKTSLAWSHPVLSQSFEIGTAVICFPTANRYWGPGSGMASPTRSWSRADWFQRHSTSGHIASLPDLIVRRWGAVGAVEELYDSLKQHCIPLPFLCFTGIQSPKVTWRQECHDNTGWERPRLSEIRLGVPGEIILKPLSAPSLRTCYTPGSAISIPKASS